MSKISEEIIQDYRKNIIIEDVEFYKLHLWDSIVIKIIDNNKKHFKNKTIREDLFYNEECGLKHYVEFFIEKYIESKISQQIIDLEAYQILSKYKEEEK